jgi:hypothetical protein
MVLCKYYFRQVISKLLIEISLSIRIGSKIIKKHKHKHCKRIRVRKYIRREKRKKERANSERKIEKERTMKKLISK